MGNLGGKVSELRVLLEYSSSFNLGDVSLLIVSPVNRFYLSGFFSSVGAIFITKKSSYLFLDARYFSAALGVTPEFEVVLANNFIESVSDVINKENIKNVFVENDYVNLNLANKLERAFLKYNCKLSKDDVLSSLLFDMRSVKSQSELEFIKESQRITEKVFDYALKLIKPGITELSIATELEFFARKLGAKSKAFEFIVASGENSAIPHHSSGSKKIQSNDIVLLDIGVNFNGYMSDMSRTIFVGKPSGEQKEVYNLVLKAQELAISSVKPGVLFSKIDSAIRGFINSTKYKNKFIHSIGHGVGLEIHEEPFGSSKSKDILKEGMVLTIEPGIYLDGKFGVRIEDMLLVTKEGCENLTHAIKGGQCCRFLRANQLDLYDHSNQAWSLPQ